MIRDEWPLVSAAEMRALDQHTIETVGVPGEVLMEHAGAIVAREVAALRQPGGRVRVVCGRGNNGGDGLVVARLLHLRGIPVEIEWASAPRRLSPDASANWARARAAGCSVASARGRLPEGSVVVDAIFGTGLSRPLDAERIRTVRRINGLRPQVQVVSVDVPSGLDSDTGQSLGATIDADCTVTIGLPKRGLALEPGRSQAGRIVVARVGIVDSAPGVSPTVSLWSPRRAAAALPARPADGHKGRFGHVLIVAGAPGTTGAAGLAARGAHRIGAGLVTIACPEGAAPVIEGLGLETMTAPLPEDAPGIVGEAALARVVSLARERDVVAIGPGLGRSDATRALVRSAARQLRMPLVVDADGLHAFVGGLDVLKARGAATILTPHPGEAAALLETTAAGINRDRISAAQALAHRTGACVVLKGAATVIAASTGESVINPTGGPVLGAGGSGDVLTGIVAGCLGQGLDALDAATLGVWIHGAAADRWSARFGASGLLASELADALPACCEALRALPVDDMPDWSGDALAFPEPR